MKKVLFSALAVMAVGATAFGAYQTNNEKYVSTLFLDGVEALANPNEDNSQNEGYAAFSRNCTLTIYIWDDATNKEKEEKVQSLECWCEKDGPEEICLEFCDCDECFS